jgi:hypothetical protein
VIERVTDFVPPFPFKTKDKTTDYPGQREIKMPRRNNSTGGARGGQGKPRRPTCRARQRHPQQMRGSRQRLSEVDLVRAEIEAEATAEAEARAEALAGVRALMSDPAPKFRPLQESLIAEFHRDIDAVAARFGKLVQNVAKHNRRRFRMIASPPDEEAAS